MAPESVSRKLFFVVGPLRTGSSLMSRCLDDHPRAICLCESEINRALFNDYYVWHHCHRMAAHGIPYDEAARYLDHRRQEDVDSFLGWYEQVYPRFRQLYSKPPGSMFGDKSPDFYQSPKLVEVMARDYPLIYTVRDPRAIFQSIEVQTDATPEDKAERWQFLIENYKAWKPHLDRPNMLVVRYEDLVTSPARTMQRVYQHLGLPTSWRFFTAFPRLFPGRFLWTSAVDWSTGVSKDFDRNRLTTWKNAPAEGGRMESVIKEEIIAEFMDRFNYLD